MATKAPAMKPAAIDFVWTKISNAFAADCCARPT